MVADLNHGHGWHRSSHRGLDVFAHIAEEQEAVLPVADDHNQAFIVVVTWPAFDDRGDSNSNRARVHLSPETPILHLVSRRRPRGPELADIQRCEHGDESSEVIRVGVGEDHAIQASHALAPQPMEQALPGWSSIDEPVPTIRPLDQGGAALPDCWNCLLYTSPSPRDS